MSTIFLANWAAMVAALAIGDPSPKVLELGVHYGAPERVSASVTGVFLHGDPHATGAYPKALALRAAAGPGGVSAGIGPRVPRYGPFGPEALITVSRTFSSPLSAAGRSTYVGVEVGYVTLGRVSIGVAHQVDGPSDRRDTIVTWSVGAQIPYGFWRW